MPLLRSLALAGLVALVAVGTTSGAADTGGHWPRVGVANIEIVDTVGLGQPLQNAVASWNLSPVINLTISSGNGGCHFQKGVIRICSVVVQDSAAWARVRYAKPATNGHFDAALIYVNLAYSAWLPSGNAHPAFAEYALCHEIGHALGLSHDQDEPGCLSLDSLPTPAPSDYADLLVLYGHGDGSARTPKHQG